MRMPTGEHTGEYIETNSNNKVCWSTKNNFSYLTGQISFYGIWFRWILHQEGKDMLGDFFVV